MAAAAFPNAGDMALPLGDGAQLSVAMRRQERRLRAEQLVRNYYAFVWRTAKGMGLEASDAEDVTQRVMMVAARRIDDLDAGKERAFLSKVTYHLVRQTYRTRRRHPEDSDERVAESEAPGPALDELADQHRALLEFQRVVVKIPEKLRLPFLLFEVEGCSKPEIAEALGIAVGTVASRIRRARQLFQQHVLRARLGAMRAAP